MPGAPLFDITLSTMLMRYFEGESGVVGLYLGRGGRNG
jgi:hypothetical protein